MYPDIEIDQSYPEQVTGEYLGHVEEGVKDSVASAVLLGLAALLLKNHKIMPGALVAVGAVKTASAYAQFGEVKQLTANHDFLR